MDVDRRPATKADFHFLYELHKSALAAARDVPVRLSVLKANPSKALYERLGFHVTGDDDVRWFMSSEG